MARGKKKLIALATRYLARAFSCLAFVRIAHHLRSDESRGDLSKTSSGKRLISGFKIGIVQADIFNVS